jgi:TonB family protein
VDSSGNVAEARLEAGGSPYFGRLALEAARQWQFAPVEGAGQRKWTLRFEIMRTATEVIPLRAERE